MLQREWQSGLFLGRVRSRAITMKTRIKIFLKNLLKKLIRLVVNLAPKQKKRIQKLCRYIIDTCSYTATTNTLNGGKTGRVNKKGHHIDPKVFCLNLIDYDVVSFDIFDTLIVRDFEDPKVIFDLWGAKYKIQYGRKMRADSERMVREKNGDREVTLREIHNDLALRCGISAEESMQTEIELEIAHCNPNLYFIEILIKLQEINKPYIITSDMYLPKQVIETMLQKCGISGHEKLFLSSECGVSKAGGELYTYVKETYGEKKYIHIGDNKVSDVENALNAGWNAVLYENVHSVGKKFRPNTMSSIGGDFYKGLVNSYLFNGLETQNKYYDVGYVHFGLFVYGFCHWLGDLVETEKADLVLFAARDMFLVEKVFQKFYPNTREEYFEISRLSIIKADFANSQEMFFTCMKDVYNNQPELCIDEYFVSIGFEFMFDLFRENNLDKSEYLNDDSFDLIRDIIKRNQEFIIKSLKKDREAAINYVESILANHPDCNKIIFVDMNGRCTGTLAVQHLVDSIREEISVVGAQAYSISVKGFVEMKFSDCTLYSFLFSYLENRDLYNSFRRNAIEKTQVIESIFTSDKGTLLSYVPNESGEKSYGSTPENFACVSEIQRGIFEFCEHFNIKANKNIPFKVTSYDCYPPLAQALISVPIEMPELKNSLRLGN